MTRCPRTLFLRLLMLTLPVESLILALFGVGLVRGVERDRLADFDSSLRAQGGALIASAEFEAGGELTLEFDMTDLPPGTKFCIIDARGKSLREYPEEWLAGSGLQGGRPGAGPDLRSAMVQGSRYRMLKVKNAADRSEAGESLGPPEKALQLLVLEPLAALDLSNRQLREKALGTALALLVLTALLLWVAINVGLRPVRDLTDRLEQIPGPTGSERLDVEPVLLELVPLAQEINNLLDRLWGLIETEKRFTAEAAHEFRTPLALVKSTLQAALLRAHTPDMYAQAVREALEDLGRLERTAELLLTLTRSDADGSGELASVETVALPDLLGPLAQQFEQGAKERSLALTLDLNPCQVQGDPQALERLFGNLLENAVRYTAQGGTIVLRCGAEEQGVLVAVEDSGPAISIDERQHLFQRFFRGTSSRAAKAPGTGLGLPIAMAIARAHGAELAYEPCGETGNRFIMRFPASPGTQPPLLQSEARKGVI